MRVIRAEHMGLCFGVRDALAVARTTSGPEDVSIYGELVHNPVIQSELKTRGFQVVQENDRDTAHLSERVMITAHGISQKRLQVLALQSSEIIDTTCPLVRRVHEATQMLERENRCVVLIGRSNHVEVQGIVEDLRRCIVVESPEQVREWNEPLLGVVSQSTTTPELAQRCLARILESNPHADVRYMDTICRPTRQRQQSLVSLCQAVKLVIVVGGKHSNNTRQLALRCMELGCKSIQIESEEELQSEWFVGMDVVGLTAGTSTPDETIDAIAKRLESYPTLKPQIDSIASSKRIGELFSHRWLRYFEENQSVEPPILWSSDSTLTVEERVAIARSVQIFQLGETGSGRNFLMRANDWGQANHDPYYPQAAAKFIQEEHRHARWLGQFLDQEGIGRLENQWTDSVFRRMRRVAGLRTAIAVLVSAEIMAQVYYRALKMASNSPTLDTMCQQILREEAQHVRFQVTQLARMDSNHSDWKRGWFRRADQLLFSIASWVVYHDHAKVFRKAGVTKKRFKTWCKRRWASTEKIYEIEVQASGRKLS